LSLGLAATARLLQAWRLPAARKWLLLVCALALTSTAWRVRTWRFARLAATLGTPRSAVASRSEAGGASGDPAPGGIQPAIPAADRLAHELRCATEVRWAVGVWSRRWRPAPTCLMQAAAAQWVLARQGVPSTLYFGVRGAAPGAALPAAQRALGAHAWLRCAGLVVTGEREMAAFRPIAAYESQPVQVRP
jgi:hypothetical protein